MTSAPYNTDQARSRQDLRFGGQEFSRSAFSPDRREAASFARSAGNARQICRTADRLDTELINYEYWGFDVTSPGGENYLILCWSDPILVAQAGTNAQGETGAHRETGARSDNVYAGGPLHGLSITRPDGSVLQLELRVGPENPERFRYYSNQLGKIADKLQRHDSWQSAWRKIDQFEQDDLLSLQDYRPTLELYCGSSIEDLRGWLDQFKIDYSAWGTGRTKTIECLHTEIVRGEGLLSFENGEAYLTSRVVLLWVTSPDGQQRVIELGQRFNDGRAECDQVRIRRTLGAMPAEKMLPNESVLLGARRALAEELGIHDIRNSAFRVEDVSQRLDNAECFPGLVRRITCFAVHVELPQEAMRDRYVEHGPARDTYFGWVPVPRNGESGAG